MALTYKKNTDPKKAPDPARLNYIELAEQLRVQPCTVRYWTRFGCPYEPAGKLRFYNLENVKTWLREQDEKKRAEKAARVNEAA